MAREVHVQLIVVIRTTISVISQNEPKPKSRCPFSQEARAGARMVMMNATRRRSANSAPRPHRDGRTAYIQSRRLVI